MFCKKCGCVIDDDAIFCYKCGTKVFSGSIHYQPTVDTPEINEQTTNVEPVTDVGFEETPVITLEETKTESNKEETAIRRLTCNSLATKSIAGYTVSAIIGIVWAIDIFSKIANGYYYDDPSIWAYLLIIISTAEFILGIVLYACFKERFTDIHNTYICGCGAGSTGLYNRNFKIEYKDIINLEKNDFFKTITIHTTFTKQGLTIEPKDFEDVYLLIRGLVDKSKNI